MKTNLSMLCATILIAGNLFVQDVFAANGLPPLEFILVSPVASPGQKVTVSVKTLPGVKCQIEVQEENISQAFALRPIDADETGKAVWIFEVNKNYKADKLPIIVTATLNNDQEEKIMAAIPINSSFISRQSLQLSLESEPVSALPGEDVTIAVRATPGTKLKIEAQEASLNEAIDLGDKIADNAGRATWTFKIKYGYRANKMPIIITGKCPKGEKKLISAISISQM